MSYDVNKVDESIDKVKEVLNEVMKENNFNIKQIKHLVNGAVEEIEKSK